MSFSSLYFLANYNSDKVRYLNLPGFTLTLIVLLGTITPCGYPGESTGRVTESVGIICLDSTQKNEGNPPSPPAATPASGQIPSTSAPTNASQEEIIIKVVDKLADALIKKVSEAVETKEAGTQTPAGSQPAPSVSTMSATPAVAEATIPSTTKDPALLHAADLTTEAIVKQVSKAIESTRTGVVKAFGGPTSTVAQIVDQILSTVQINFFGWPLWQYILSFLIIFLALTLRQIIATWLLKIVIRLTSLTKVRFGDILVRFFEAIIPPLRFAVVLFGVYISVQIFFTGHPLPPTPKSLLDQSRYLFRGVFYLLLLVDMAWAFCRIADAGIEIFSRISQLKETRLDETFVPIARRSAKTFIIVIFTLQILYYFDFGAIVGSLLAAAGVSGLAIGLAAQDTIKNFFGSIVLLSDRPFSIGDWIIAGETEGIVESLGFRSTKIRTFSKTLVTIPNSAIVDRDIDNISRRKVRRIKFYLGISYQTTPAQMEELLRRIRDFLRTDDDVWPNTILVRFTDFGDSALNIFIYYFSKTTVWDEHLAVREKVNLAIIKIVEELGLEIAFPTQTVYLRHDEPPLPPPSHPTPEKTDTEPKETESPPDESQQLSEGSDSYTEEET